MSLLDELNSNQVDVRCASGEETGLTLSDFNYAWLVPVVVTVLNRDYYELQLEKMRYIINAARTGSALNVIAVDKTLNYPNNLVDACSSSR